MKIAMETIINRLNKINNDRYTVFPPAIARPGVECDRGVQVAVLKLNVDNEEAVYNVAQGVCSELGPLWFTLRVTEPVNNFVELWYKEPEYTVQDLLTIGEHETEADWLSKYIFFGGPGVHPEDSAADMTDGKECVFTLEQAIIIDGYLDKAHELYKNAGVDWCQHLLDTHPIWWATYEKETEMTGEEKRKQAHEKFTQMIDDTCRQLYDHFEGDGELGVNTPYISVYDCTAFVQLVEVDGSPNVRKVMDKLAEILPEGYGVCHNSPTDGTVLIHPDSDYNPNSHIDTFKMFWERYVTEKELPPLSSSYRYEVLYLDQYLDRCEESAEELIAMLNNKEEIIHQLLKLDHGWDKVERPTELTTKLDSSEEFKRVHDILIEQVLDLCNYYLEVHVKITIEDIKASEMTFYPDNADSFEFMNNYLKQVAMEDGLGIDVTVTNLK